MDSTLHKADKVRRGIEEDKDEGRSTSVWNMSVHKSVEAESCWSGLDWSLCRTNNDRSWVLRRGASCSQGSARLGRLSCCRSSWSYRTILEHS